MEQLPRLKARISGLAELRDLIRALRAMAASRVQEAQAALPGIRNYVAVVENAIAEGIALLPDDGAAPPDAQGPRALLVICSEHGFAGAFNDRLLDRAAEERRPGDALGIVGQRGAILAGERGLDVAWRFPMATHIGGVLGVTRRVSRALAAAPGVRVVFGRYEKGGRYAVEAKDILPLDPALVVSSRRRGSPLHHLAPEVLTNRLAGEYLFAEITSAVTESLASENGARLHVMEAADRNIHDKLDDLGRTERTLRQEAITTELLDVVTGSAAVLGR